ncbi:hypothetical protein MKX01_012485 [Papaver californicum]|nr:hypothetical protein MKX01_012485 [Papaver californicum]
MRWEGDMSGKKKLGFSPSVVFIPSEPSLHGGVWSTLSVQSKGHALYVFINGRFSGSACGTSENKQFSSMNLTERFSGMVHAFAYFLVIDLGLSISYILSFIVL